VTDERSRGTRAHRFRRMVERTRTSSDDNERRGIEREESMNNSERNLTNKQLMAIPIIISARTITEGCKQAGISKTIFYEWLKDDLFKQEFIAMQNDLIETALKELKGLSAEAVEELGTLLRETQNENIKLKTIDLILEHTMKIKEFEDIEQRLEAIEQMLSK
jgi:Helix-turn-helix of insertion element transposase